MRVLVVDDHWAFRLGVKTALEHDFPSVVVREASSLQEMVGLLGEPFELAILDLMIPGSGYQLEALKVLKARHPALPVLIYTAQPEERFAVRAIQTGAAGYLMKDADNVELGKAAHKLLAGELYITSGVAELLARHMAHPEGHETLSEREQEVFHGLVMGEAVHEIGERLHLSAKTVSTYRSRILEKLGLSSNSELVRYALHHNLLGPE